MVRDHTYPSVDCLFGRNITAVFALAVEAGGAAVRLHANAPFLGIISNLRWCKIHHLEDTWFKLFWALSV